MFNDRPNGYLESIRKGTAAVSRFHSGVYYGRDDRDAEIRRLRKELDSADAVVIGAGAGLSTSAGMIYSGERFESIFPDFAARFGLRDMYSAGFYLYPDAETRWAFWARNIYYNRYVDPPKPVYDDLLQLVKGKDYFVITTNVDHIFQRAGFDKSRLFYTQGDYGLFQDADGRSGLTYDNEAWVMKALEAQGFEKDEDGIYRPVYGKLSMRLPSELVPKSPAGRPVAMNLRADDTFVEDEGWHAASANYADFLKNHEKGRVLYLELGVGSNTPVIIKFPFWAMTSENPDAVYACLNCSEAFAPNDIAPQSILIDGDTGDVLKQLIKIGG